MIFTVEEDLGGDEFMAVKPWLGAIKTPSNFAQKPKDFDKQPEIELKLEHVHGYRAKDARSNIFYNTDGNIVTHAAGVGLTHNVASNSQFHNQAHIDDIMSIAEHPGKSLYATGEIGPKPHIIIWDSTNHNQTQLTIRKGVLSGVDTLGFSPDGKYLAASCMDPWHTIVIFDSNSGEIVGSNKGTQSVIIDLIWDTDSTFVTFGVHHYKYWSFKPGQTPTGKDSKPGNGFKDMITCGQIFGDQMLHGASNGELQVWSKGSFLKGFKEKARPHTSCLDAIAIVQDKYILTGGKDHTICVMDTAFAVLQKINTYTLFPKCFNGNVRALTYKAKGNKLCVGLFSSEIYECTLTVVAQGTMEVQNVLSGHYSNSTVWTNEVWGLERYQKNPDLYLTCSMDGTFREWSISKKTQTRAIRLDIDEKGSVLPLRTDAKGKNDLQDMGKLMCIGVDMEDKFAAVGCKDGTIRFVDLTSPELRQTKMIKLAKEWISDIKWSPNNDKLAIGSHDNAIYILTWPDVQIPRRSKMQKHSSFITHLDWSISGDFLHSTCGAYELLFWDANSYRQMPSGATALRDEPWHTWSVTLGWPVQEIFRDNWDGSDVNMVWRSQNKFGTQDSNKYPLLATADDEGKVRVYRWPVLRKNAGVVTGDGHSSHVTNVRFLGDDDWCVSTGGEDQCVFQWRVIGGGEKVRYMSG
jgi:WD40 repeat protein